MAVKKILVFGNSIVKKDSIALKILPSLRREFQEIEFREMDGIEDVQNEGKDVVIMDCVEGIEKSELITDIDSLKSGNKYSTHDFDIAQNLKLLKKIGAVEKVTIIGIPVGIGESEAISQAKKIILSII